MSILDQNVQEIKTIYSDWENKVKERIRMKPIIHHPDNCDTCNGRYYCIQDCPTQFIEKWSESGVEKVRFKDRGRCIGCAHCFAICPKEVFSLGVESEEKANDEFEVFLHNKRTVRSYSKHTISEQELELIISAMQSSPTQKNKSAVKIYIVKSKLEQLNLLLLDSIKKIVDEAGPLHPQYSEINEMYEKHSSLFWGAEYGVLITGREMSLTDASICAERGQLMAHKLGIGTAYNGNVTVAANNDKKVYDFLGLKSGEKVLVSFALGKTKLRYERPIRKNNKRVVIL